MFRYFFIISGLLLSIVSCTTPPRSEAKVVQRQPRSLDWLIKDDSLNRHIEINEAGIALYVSGEDKEAGLPECRIYPDEYNLTARLFDVYQPDSLLVLYLEKGLKRWEEILPILPTEDTLDFPFYPDSTLPMKGLKIAVDPGHTSADLATAEIEGKYMKMRGNKRKGKEAIAFFEPELTLATAWIIRDSLEKLGAEVMMTREIPGKSIRGKTFEEWKKEDKDSTMRATAIEQEWDKKTLNYWLKKANEKELFKFFFNADDLRARAEKINAFQPDLTLIIHYNIHSPNWDARDKKGFFKPTDANYAMAFIPGGFIRNELGTPEDRLALLRMLITDDVERSHLLARNYMYQTTKITSVPAVRTDSKLPYLDVFSIYTGSPGVYARNLSLSRKVWGPLIYGESMCQDNRIESVLLNERDIEVHGVKTSSLLIDMANVYIASVWAYARMQ